MGKTVIQSEKVLLWENPSPTSDFTSAIVVNGIDLTQFSYIEIYAYTYVNMQHYVPVLKIPVPQSGVVTGVIQGIAGNTGLTTGTPYVMLRMVAIHTDKVVINTASGGATTGTWTSPTPGNAIPVRVYGIK